MRLRATSSVIGIGSTAPSSHADCARWAFATSPLHQPHLAERLCRTADRIDPARVFGPHHCLGRGTSALGSEIVRSLLQRRQNASVSKQGCAGFSAGSAIRFHKFARHLGWTSPPLRAGLIFRYTQPGERRARRRADRGTDRPDPHRTHGPSGGDGCRGALPCLRRQRLHDRKRSIR